MDVDFTEKTGSPEEVAAEQQEQEKIDKAGLNLLMRTAHLKRS